MKKKKIKIKQKKMKEMAKKYFVDIDKRTKLKKERKKQKKKILYMTKKKMIFSQVIQYYM